MEKLGAYLKREREARNCSLEEISAVTKIRKGILSAIENDDYSLLTSAIFVKGFIKAYALYLGLDWNEILKRYQEEIEIKFKGEEEEIKKEEKEFIYKKSTFLFIAATLILLIAVFLIILKPSPIVQNSVRRFSRNIVTSREIQKVKPDNKLNWQVPMETSHEKKVLALEEGSEVKRLNLALKAKEETWIGYKVDNERSSQLLLKAGESFLLRADRIIRLKIGNAGGVDLFLNGRNIPEQGKSGEVVRLILTEEGLSKQKYDEQLIY